MEIKQREVYMLPHPTNSQTVEEHPFIILSDYRANRHERTFICAMVTSSEYTTKTKFSFPLNDNMFVENLKEENCFVQMHLITLWWDEMIKGKKVNEMKEQYFKELMRSIGDLVFNYSFEPK